MVTGVELGFELNHNHRKLVKKLAKRHIFYIIILVHNWRIGDIILYIFYIIIPSIILHNSYFGGFHRPVHHMPPGPPGPQAARAVVLYHVRSA